jgi:hypothetical protein
LTYQSINHQTFFTANHSKMIVLPHPLAKKASDRVNAELILSLTSAQKRKLLLNVPEEDVLVDLMKRAHHDLPRLLAGKAAAVAAQDATYDLDEQASWSDLFDDKNMNSSLGEIVLNAKIFTDQDILPLQQQPKLARPSAASTKRNNSNPRLRVRSTNRALSSSSHSRTSNSSVGRSKDNRSVKASENETSLPRQASRPIKARSSSGSSLTRATGYGRKERRSSIGVCHTTTVPSKDTTSGRVRGAKDEPTSERIMHVTKRVAKDSLHRRATSESNSRIISSGGGTTGSSIMVEPSVSKTAQRSRVGSVPSRSRIKTAESCESLEDRAVRELRKPKRRSVVADGMRAVNSKSRVR